MYRPTIPLNNVGGLSCFVADGENYALSKKGTTGDKEDWVRFSRPTRMKSPHAMQRKWQMKQVAIKMLQMKERRQTVC